jgi:hypothetical protein
VTGVTGSLHLAALVRFLAGLGKSGRVAVAQGGWRGEVRLHRGALVGARLGDTTGAAAFEGMALGLRDARFVVRDEAEPGPDGEGQWRVAADALPAYLERLLAERERLLRLVPSLRLVPRPRSVPVTDGQVTIGADALALLPALAGRETVEHLARTRGLAACLRQVAALVELGLVELGPAAPPASQPSAPVPSPAPVPAKARRGLGARLVAFFVADSPPTRPVVPAQPSGTWAASPDASAASIADTSRRADSALSSTATRPPGASASLTKSMINA